MTAERLSGRELHLLTTDVLLADLIVGQSVALGDGESLELGSDNARAVLDWYRRNPRRWTANQSADDIEAILDMIGKSPPAIETARASVPLGAVQRLRLIKVVAHRFAGLHVHGSATEPPETFIFEPGKAVTLFEGANGSGKTSLANAILWCLTGQLIRSQREPGDGTTEYPCEVDLGDGTKSVHPISSVTPMPLGPVGLPANSEPIPADTWVEVTFANGNGNALPALVRRQTRTARGKLTETPPDLDAIGIDPIAWRIATTMPALLPYLAVGAASQLGHAVARLTGLADLVDLSKHAGAAAERIAKRRTKELENEREEIEQRYDQAKADIDDILAENVTITLSGRVPAIDATGAHDTIVGIADGLVASKAAALAQAKNILGEGFDPESKTARDSLEADIRPATEQIAKLGDLASIRRLSSLALDPADAVKISTMLAQIHEEAATLAALAASPGRAQRAQLYARVSAWIHEHGILHRDTCPLCVGALLDARDPVSGNLVVDHLDEAERDREVVARTVADWSLHWCGKLLQDLPEAIAAEARKDLPDAPRVLLRNGLIDELFGTLPFRGALAALRTDAENLVDTQLASLPIYQKPNRALLPDAIARTASALQQMIDRIGNALAFAEWRSSSATALRETFHAIRRGEDSAPDAERALGRRLNALMMIVDGVGPLTKTIQLTERLEANRRGHEAKQKRIGACRKAVLALDALVPLGELAQAQVDLLRTKLHTRAEYWRKAMFRNATDFAPDLKGTGMDAKGVLELRVGREGVTAPAQHVSNASALRGALLGFFLAFREHVLTTRGGLALLILDDPQELLDNGNRERLARGLSLLAKGGAQLVVTTHDRKFARSMVAENRADDNVEHLSVHGVNAVRPTLVVAPAIEEIDDRRQGFLKNVDSHGKAQDYASDLRVYLESRLGDLFDDVAQPAYATSTRAVTLFPLMDKLRGLVSAAAGELFANPVVKRFVEDPALAEGAEPRRVLNQSHHDKASITYMDVKMVQADFNRLRTQVERVHEQFRLHRWREPLLPDEQRSSTIVPLRSMVRPRFSIPLCPDIAAFVRTSTEHGSQELAVETLDDGWFEGKALFYIRGDTLGFAIPGGDVAIVDAEPYPGRDQNLVIARHRSQILARRMVTSSGSIGISLSAQMPDPRTRRTTLTFDESKVRLNRIVGALFTKMPPPEGGGEAVAIDHVPELDAVAVAYRVKEESAIPLALPNQIILGADMLLPNELDRWEGTLVAVTLEDGSSIFKRVGTKLPGELGYLRQFETIGGLGSSVIVATESVEGAPPVPLMRSARRVVGVLYDRI